MKRAQGVPRSFFKRGLYSLALVVFINAVGTVGMHFIEGLPYIDAFYFTSMLATAQGPPTAPVTVAGKIFSAIMAYISVGSIVVGLGFLFGPFFGALWRIGVQHIEGEAHVLLTRIEEQETLLKEHMKKKGHDN